MQIVPATVELVDAELRDPAELADALGAELPPDWPPEFHGPEQLAFTREALARDGAAGWWLHYVLAEGGGIPVLAGVCGTKGPPGDDGVVEVGYSVVASHRRRGLATAAVAALIDSARARGARTVTAHTLPHLEPSIGVLRKLGFVPADPPEEGVLAFAKRLAG